MSLNVYLNESSANLKSKRVNRPLVVSLSIGHDPPDELARRTCFGICLVLWEEIVFLYVALWWLQYAYVC